MPSPEQQTHEQQTTGKRFGHTSGRRLPQYVRYRTNKKGNREFIAPPVKARRVKPSRLFMADTHPLRRLVAAWERGTAQ